MTTQTEDAARLTSDGPAQGASPASIVVERRIEWPDTDASGRWHNTAAFRFIEVAETALLERLGLLDEVYGRLPRVRIEADFKKLLLFRDLLECSIAVASIGRSSITYDFAMRKDGETCVTAKVVAALLDEAGDPSIWSEDHRRTLLTAGPQAPERLVQTTKDES
ncbi:MAG: acyl-CoA thioesterase [Actinomycetota bacterium]|nr:acyl-CoA thioesterase [Actinomycetota bacterium]